MTDAIDTAYGELKSAIFELIECKPDHINDKAGVKQREILGNLPDKINDIVRKELNDIKDSANRKISDLDGVRLKRLEFSHDISAGVEIGFSGAFDNLDIDLDEVLGWVSKTAGTAAAGAGIGSLAGPIGTFVGAGIGALVGGIFSAVESNNGKAVARKEVTDAISKAKEMTKEDIGISLQPVYKDVNDQNRKLKTSIKSELENIDELRHSLENFGENIAVYVKILNTKQYGSI